MIGRGPAAGPASVRALAAGLVRDLAPASELVFVLVLVIGLVLAGCGGPAAPGTTPGSAAVASLEPAASGTPAPPPSPVTGVLVAIEAEGLANVKGFTLRTNDGQEVVFRIGILENGAQFPPGHLAEHLATSSPVRVFYRTEGADLVVYRIEDANQG